jgi:cytoskeletal protein RodZ
MATRFVEHLHAFENSQPEESAVSEHMLMKDDKKKNYRHKFEVSGLKLMISVSNHRTLDFLQSYFIRKQNRQCNKDEGPLKSPLFDVV